jgi:formylglycine-generating enzyme required for sulfatase activity
VVSRKTGKTYRLLTEAEHEYVTRAGTGPPTQIPLCFDAAILSRTRSPITSRSNWAKDNRVLSVSRPMLVVVLKDWLTRQNNWDRK